MNTATLLLLAACNLIVGTGSMVITGLLVPIGTDLGVSTAVAAQLLTAYSIAFAVSAPLVAVLAARMCRKRLLVLALSGYGAMMALASIVPSYELLWVVRAAAGAASAAFIPNASAVTGALAAPEQRGRSLAIVFGGFTAAMVLGAPLGTYVGGIVGWRETTGAIGAVALVVAQVVRRRLPGGIMLQGATVANLRSAVAHPTLLALIGLNILVAFGSSVLFGYAAIAFPALLRAPPQSVAVALLVFGIGSLAGNVASAGSIDRFGAARMATLAFAAAAVALATLGSAGPVLLGWAALAGWGMASSLATTAQQVRLVSSAPALSAALLPLNASAMFVGASLGAVLGGLWLARENTVHGLVWIASGALAASTLSSLLLPDRAEPLSTSGATT